MLVFCVRDGLTCNEKVYMKGDVFILSEELRDVYGGLTAAQIVRKQKDVYGFELFRLALEEDMWNAYKEDNTIMDKLDPSEKHVIGRFLQSTSEKIKAAAEAISPTEEKEEKKEVEPVVQESSDVEIKAPPKKKTRKTSAKK